MVRAAGWKKHWDWGDPPSFGAVSSGKVDIFLCLDGQGGRGKGTNIETFTADDNDKGVWMSIWVDDVDAIHQHYLANNIEVTFVVSPRKDASAYKLAYRRWRVAASVTDRG